ncbi:hypothetical protein M3Y99_01153100 [Aphelenchoides fujianensis]|nr:hypothetical protein M3Y99_01153100 [Aphelenchoides fujianensis]
MEGDQPPSTILRIEPPVDKFGDKTNDEFSSLRQGPILHLFSLALQLLLDDAMETIEQLWTDALRKEESEGDNGIAEITLDDDNEPAPKTEADGLEILGAAQLEAKLAEVEAEEAALKAENKRMFSFASKHTRKK